MGENSIQYSFASLVGGRVWKAASATVGSDLPAASESRRCALKGEAEVLALRGSKASDLLEVLNDKFREMGVVFTDCKVSRSLGSCFGFLAAKKKHVCKLLYVHIAYLEEHGRSLLR